jgi:DNA-directed RNA polymerase specialized sigma24 family protein
MPLDDAEIWTLALEAAERNWLTVRRIARAGRMSLVDAKQEYVLFAAKALRSFRFDKGTKPETYLNRCTENFIRALYKKSQRDVTVGASVYEDVGQDDTAAVERSVDLLRTVQNGRLQKKEKDAIVARLNGAPADRACSRAVRKLRASRKG